MTSHLSAGRRPTGAWARLSQWYGDRRSGRTALVAWLATRALMIIILTAAERFIVGDVLYYRRKLAALTDVGLARTLNEYPTPVTWILWLPYGLTGGTRTGYLVGFIVAMVILDGVFAYGLWRAADRVHTVGLDFWILFVFLIGPLSFVRFDILPAVLAGGALLALRRRPGLTGALTGLGAAVKLWPALLIGLFLSRRRARRPAGIGFVVVGIGLALVSLLTGGLARLFSPLTWQSDRGLQIESVWATPLMVARLLRPDLWRVSISRYQAYEVFGPGVPAFLLASTIATAAGLLVILALHLRAFRRTPGDPSDLALGAAVLTVVAIMIITNKTLSPQYLLWLGGPMAALLVARRSDRTDNSPAPPSSPAPIHPALVRLGGQLVVLALLNQLVYPLLYNGILGVAPRLTVVSTVVTAVRNLALVALTVQSAALAWRWLRPSTVDTAPPG